jgi:hypothetical protein
MRKKRVISSSRVQKFVASAVGEDLHAKRVLSLSQGTVGVIHAAALGVSAIGRGLALAEGLSSKHAIKQVDRLLSNAGVEVWPLFSAWVPFMLGSRSEIVVAMDWTDFDADDQTTLALHLLTSHGRATPLMWKTVRKSELKGNRNRVEDELLIHLRAVVPADVTVTILADRGFGDADLYALLWELRFDYVIRFRAVIRVTDPKGESKPAREWVPDSGRPKMLHDALVTGRKTPIPAVVCVKAKGMKDAWCLATSLGEKSAAEVVKLYGKRFTIEESFRDAKDPRFGMGLSNARIDTPARRDRLLLLSAMATVLLTLLGAAGESIGLDRLLKANTDKRRTHSLLFQGSHYYAAMPMMRESDFERLAIRFGEMLREQAVFRGIFGVI